MKLFLLMSLLLTVACGRKSSSPEAAKELFTPDEDFQMMTFAENQEFECASIDGTPCPSGIARLITKTDGKEAELCTGFMISDDTLITNNHCVPDLKSCNSTYISIFNGTGPEPARCESIKRVLKDYGAENPRKRLDVSVIKLDRKFSGKVFKASSHLFSAGESATVWAIDHTGIYDERFPNMFQSRITELRCTLDADSRRRAVRLQNCPVIKGNSGGPLLDSNGDVLGVIWGGSIGDKVKANHTLGERRSLTSIAVATDVVFFRRYFPE